MTDVILGIDFQREYRISYDWDEEKQCYIRYKGQFLCYTVDMESGINRVSVARTVTQDTPAQTGTPAGTETQDRDPHRTATKSKADQPTDSGQITIDHQLRTPGIILGVDHPHATMTSHIDVA